MIAIDGQSRRISHRRSSLTKVILDWRGHLLRARHEEPSPVPSLPVPESEGSEGVVSLESLHDAVVQEPVDAISGRDIESG